MPAIVIFFIYFIRLKRCFLSKNKLNSQSIRQDMSAGSIYDKRHLFCVVFPCVLDAKWDTKTLTKHFGHNMYITSVSQVYIADALLLSPKCSSSLYKTKIIIAKIGSQICIARASAAIHQKAKRLACDLECGILNRFKWL